jgi:thioredoxin-related protein
MKLFLVLLAGCFWYPAISFAQLKPVEPEQIDSLQKAEKRIVVIFIHTDWCKYCQAFKNTTLTDKNVTEQLNNKFYFISFNAEEKRVVNFNRQKFHYKPTGSNTGIHQFAEQLALVEDTISYPAFCFLNPAFEIIYQTTDFKSKSDFLDLLKKME